MLIYRLCLKRHSSLTSYYKERCNINSYFPLIFLWIIQLNDSVYRSQRYKLLSEATPRTIVGTEGTMKVLLPEYQVYKCFIILNNCAIKILDCMSFSDGFLVYNKCLLFIFWLNRIFVRISRFNPYM
jgi:hypothetical protein